MEYSDTLLKVKAKINGQTVDAVACSFRGAHFFVRENQETGFGRTIVSKKVPFSGTEVHEDLGENASKLSMIFFLYGIDVDVQKQELIKACNKSGVSELTHPWLGRFQARCSNLSFNYGTERLGYISGTISFERESDLDEKSVEVNLATQTENAAGSFRNSAVAVFQNAFKVAKIAKSTLDGIVADTEQAVDRVFEIRESLNSVAEFLDAAGKLKMDAEILSQTPSILAGRVRELVEATADLFGVDRDPKVDVDEYIKLMALEKPERDFSGFSEMLFNMIRLMAASMVAQSLVDCTFVSVDEAKEFQENISSAFETLIENTDDTETYIGLNDVLSLSLGYLRDVMANAAVVLERDVKVTDNVLSLCYDTYRGVDRIEEIIDRNQIFDCMFIMPGTVKVLSK